MKRLNLAVFSLVLITTAPFANAASKESDEAPKVQVSETFHSQQRRVLEINQQVAINQARIVEIGRDLYTNLQDTKEGRLCVMKQDAAACDFMAKTMLDSVTKVKASILRAWNNGTARTDTYTKSIKANTKLEADAYQSVLAHTNKKGMKLLDSIDAYNRGAVLGMAFGSVRIAANSDTVSKYQTSLETYQLIARQFEVFLQFADISTSIQKKYYSSALAAFDNIVAEIKAGR